MMAFSRTDIEESFGKRVRVTEHDDTVTTGVFDYIDNNGITVRPDGRKPTRVILYSDLKTFALADGLTWRLGDKTRTETGLRDWIGKRAQAGRLPPQGFPKSNKFG